MTGRVPTPQSELSGPTAFGRFVWNGVVYRTAEVDGRAFVGKRRSKVASSGVSWFKGLGIIIGFRVEGPKL